MATLELWDRSEVLFPSSPVYSFHPLPFSPFLSPTLSFPTLYDGNNFNDFPGNQLTIHFAFLCKPAWGNATVSTFPRVLISFGGTAFPQTIWGNAVPPRSPSTMPLIIAIHVSGLAIFFESPALFSELSTPNRTDYQLWK